MKKNLPTSASPPSISSNVNTSAAACNSRGDAVVAVAAEALEAAQAVEVVPDVEAAAAASVAEDVAAAAGAAGAASMPSGSAISRPPAAHPGGGAAIAKSYNGTGRLSRGQRESVRVVACSAMRRGLKSSVHFRSQKVSLVRVKPASELLAFAAPRIIAESCKVGGPLSPVVRLGPICKARAVGR